MCFSVAPFLKDLKSVVHKLVKEFPPSGGRQERIDFTTHARNMADSMMCILNHARRIAHSVSDFRVVSCDVDDDGCKFV